MTHELPNIDLLWDSLLYMLYLFEGEHRFEQTHNVYLGSQLLSTGPTNVYQHELLLLVLSLCAPSNIPIYLHGIDD